MDDCHGCGLPRQMNREAHSFSHVGQVTNKAWVLNYKPRPYFLFLPLCKGTHLVAVFQ
jgi:hypothetical protein